MNRFAKASACLALLVIWAGIYPDGSRATLKNNVQEIITHPKTAGGGVPYRGCFEETAKITNLPLPLLIAIAKGESNFNPRAISSKNAIGIMQIRWPLTARELGVQSRKKLFNPCLNIQMGGKYLASLIKRYGGEAYRGIAAYNYGPGRISKNAKIPQGAHDYVDYIYEKYTSITETPLRKVRPVELTFKSSELLKRRGKLALTPYVFRFYFYAKKHMRDLTLRVKIDGVTYEIEKNAQGRYEVMAYYKKYAGARKKIADKIRSVTGWEIDITPLK